MGGQLTPLLTKLTDFKFAQAVANLITFCIRFLSEAADPVNVCAELLTVIWERRQFIPSYVPWDFHSDITSSFTTCRRTIWGISSGSK